MRYVRLTTLFIAKNMRAKLEYRSEFWINLIGRIVQTALSFVFFYVTLQQIGSLQHWSLWQLGIILSVSSLIRGIAEVFFTNVWTLPQKIRTGGLDLYLTKPLNPLFHLIVERVEVQGIGLLISGFCLLLDCGYRLHLQVTVVRVGEFALMIGCGALLYLFLLLIFATLTFWLVGADTQLMGIVITFNEFANYPLNVFPAGLTFLLTWLLPFGFTGFFPAEFLLHASSFPAMSFMILPITLLFGVIALKVWNLGLKQYHSSGF